MQIEKLPYERTIFVCSNQREKGTCCNNSGGSKIRDKLKDFLKEHNLNKRIRVSRSGCMGKCDSGVNIMVFPDNVWIKNTSEGDTMEIITKYIEPLK